MNFNIPCKALCARLSALSKVISSKNTISILGDFLFDLKDGVLTITASDSETIMTSTIEVYEAEGEGSFATDAKSLLDLLKELPDQPITFDVDEERYGLKISFMNGLYNIAGEDGVEFPRKADLGETVHEFTISESYAKKGIENTVFAVGTEDMRRIMMGILWDIKPDYITFVASDTHMLVRYRNDKIKTGITATFVLPSKAATALNNVLTPSEDPVKVIFDSKTVEFELADYSLTCRVINGRYPNYNSVIPRVDAASTLNVERQPLLAASRRMSALASTGGLVKLEISSEHVLLTTHNEEMPLRSEETVPCEYDGDEMMIGFNANKVVEILSNMCSQNVAIKLLDPSRAGVIIPDDTEEGEDMLCLLMPMML